MSIKYTDYITNSYYAEHLGIDCTGATDASAALQSAINSLPDNASLEFPLTSTIKLGTTITMADRVGIKLWSRVRQLNAPGAPQFIWTAPSGFMFDFQHCDHPSVIGLNFINDNAVGNCDTFLNFDGNPVSHIGTLGYVNYCTFNMNNKVNTNASMGMVSISRNAIQNHENYIIENCCFFGTKTTIVRALDGVTTANSPNVSSATAAWTQADVGQRIRLSYGGTGTLGGGFLDTTIKTVTNGTNIILNANADAITGNQTNVTIHTGTAYGVGIRNGASQNALQQQFRNIQVSNCSIGIQVQGGNAQMEHISGGGNDCGIFISGFVAEQCSINWYECENDARAIDYHGPGLVISNSRCSNGSQFGNGFFTFNAGHCILLLNNYTEFSPGTNQVLIGTAGAGNPAIISLGNFWNATEAQVGFPQFPSEQILALDKFHTVDFLLYNPLIADPHVKGQIWSNGGVLTISNG